MKSQEEASKPANANRSGNADYQWANFDSEAYFQHYYGEPHPDDEQVIRCAVAAMKEIPAAADGLDIVDIGTGPNLIPFFCALPRARSLSAWEFAQSNVDWLRADLSREVLRPQWQHFWGVTQEAYGADWHLPDNPLPALAAMSRITRGSVFDLPKRRWDAATMFFCAESITEREDEFAAAVAAYAQCVKPGGALAAAFLVRSAGYEVSGHRFPVLHLTPEAIESTFAIHAQDVKAERIGLVEREIRSGYSGFVFLTGRAR
jgi:NNMT/PNMT/TEMT family